MGHPLSYEKVRHGVTGKKQNKNPSGCNTVLAAHREEIVSDCAGLFCLQKIYIYIVSDLWREGTWEVSPLLLDFNVALDDL